MLKKLSFDNKMNDPILKSLKISQNSVLYLRKFWLPINPISV